MKNRTDDRLNLEQVSFRLMAQSHKMKQKLSKATDITGEIGINNEP